MISILIVVGCDMTYEIICYKEGVGYVVMMLSPSFVYTL